MVAPDRIFISAMPGAGNLGDDLISALLVRLVHERWPHASVTLVHFGHAHPFAYPDAVRMELLRPARMSEGAAGLRRSRELRRRAATADLVMVGGGGLLQDSHHPWNVHHWLRYALEARGRVWGVGLGAGPLRRQRSRLVLRRALPRFQVVQVRDPESAAMVTQLGGAAALSPDIVEGADLTSQGFVGTPDPAVLGASVRPWGSLRPEVAARILDRAAAESGAREIRLFTFEHFSPANTVERDFSRAIAARLHADGRRATEFCYRETPHDEFMDAFRSVGAAVAMRLHANVLWQRMQIAVMPLSYSPKVAALYDQPGVAGVAEAVATEGTLPIVFRRAPARGPYLLPGIESAPLRVSGPARAGDAVLDLAATVGTAAHSMLLRAGMVRG